MSFESLLRPGERSLRERGIKLLSAIVKSEGFTVEQNRQWFYNNFLEPLFETQARSVGARISSGLTEKTFAGSPSIEQVVIDATKIQLGYKPGDSVTDPVDRNQLDYEVSSALVRMGRLDRKNIEKWTPMTKAGGGGAGDY